VYPNYIKDLLQIEDVKIKKIYPDANNNRFIELETKPSAQICPTCGSTTSRIHDYRKQKIKHIPIGISHITLILNKRRYVCSCGKRFYEKYSWLPRYQHMTKHLIMYIYHMLRETISYSHVASQANVSVSTVIRTFNHIQYNKPSRMPKVISIDEFKGNAETGKYQCILVDGKKKYVLDILPDRKQSHLCSYFRDIPKKERYKVEFFVTDMWEPYRDIAKVFFPNAKIIVDKYHFARQVTWAFERVRKEIQKTMSVSLRKYYKNSRRLLLKRYNELKEEQREKCDLMLLYNDDLRRAHGLKEWFYQICDEKSYSVTRSEFLSWINNAEKSGIKDFEKCAATFRRWSKEILNAFKYGYTNGPTEGYNNKIKVLKRISFGIRNFERFRNRILHTCG
jgi:transposase